jgi:hypothetical protein
MSELEIRGAEQTLRALADAFDRPSAVAAQFQREGFRPELWDQLDRLERRKHELADSARTLANRGASRGDVVALLNTAKRYEREEDKLFVRAFWEDMGAPG